MFVLMSRMSKDHELLNTLVLCINEFRIGQGFANI